jgi:predicted Zn-dependent protease
VPRRSSPLRAVALALAVPLVALAPIAASGQPAKPVEKPRPPEGASPDRYDPDNVVAISQYMETLVKGTERFMAKDQTAAVDTFKKAVQLNPKHPLAHYLLAEAYLHANNLGEAEAAIAQAAETADPKNAGLRSRVLFLVADVQERQKKWEQAKVAWQAYAEHAARFSDAGHPQTSAERIKAIQRVLDGEKAYAAVRDRIAAERSSADAGKKK